ncbi:non-ribosomal peptide synthetase [Xenorhabdus stockiae]|uniref:non-ribosomal peptide synthetase n=1 Tax=Xenorhabdus stockiae TaxID=351614 RepID=UPI003CEB15DF
MNHPETLKPFALSEAQSSRWFQYQINPAQRGQNNSAFCARVRGLTAEKLEEALNHLIKRHPMLRASFGQYGGKLGYQIAENAIVTIKKHDARDLDAETLQQLVHNDCWYPFDLENPLRIYVSWYQCHDQECVMVLTFDHIAVDGWSYWILLEELGMLLTGQELPPAEERSYQDYVTWQQQWLNSNNAKKQQKFWIDNLSGELTELQLPVSSKSSVSAPSFVADKITVARKLPDTLAAKLIALTPKYHNSLFAIFLAAYQLLLHRYTGQDDILVGSIMPGRSRSLWGKVVGEFINPVALRAQIKGEMTVQEHILQAAKSIRQAIENQKYPFAKILEHIKLQRNADTHPVFQTTMTFQQPRYVSNLTSLWMDQSGTTTVGWGGAELRSFPYPYYAEMPVPLMINLIEIDQQINCGFHYDTKLFDSEFITQLMDNFFTLLAAIADDDQQVISHLPLMDEHQLQQVLSDFNATNVSYPKDALIHQLFEQQADHTPEAMALVYGDSQLTYDELNRRANQLAHYLIGLGVQPDDRIAICVERSPEMIVGLLGILKAGAAYVPLDPAYPAERLAYMLEDAAPVALLTQSSLTDRLENAPTIVLLDDSNSSAFNPMPDTNPDHRTIGLNSHHLAYVIYTSGSTGKPKGVMVEHHNVINLHIGLQLMLDLAPSSRVALNASIVFDASLQSWSQLLAGHTLVIIPNAIRTDGPQLWRYFEHHKVDMFDCTPVQLHGLLNAGLGTSTGYQPKLALIGGEAIHPAVWSRLQQIKTTRFINAYGPTECTVQATFCPVDSSLPLPSIGKPVANTRIYILDPNGQPTPLGVTGEIYIGGSGVSRGYLNRSELTAERFIADPFVTDPNARLYKTGDLGRWLSDGNIEYLGRNDFQVKIRGFRIELGEIEARLAQCAGVQQVVVIAREYDTADTRLVAYIVPDSDITPGISELREQLSSSLPEHMVPSAFVMLEAFPLTVSGKLDRHALPAPDYSSVSSQEYAAPQGETEEQLADIWRTILKIDRVGRHDNFFELGGHSLLVLQLQSKVNEIFEVDLSIQQLFAHPSISQLEECIINAQLMQFDAGSLQGLYESME